MESSKRGCDLGTCVVKRQRSTDVLPPSIACDLEASLGPGLAFRFFVFEKGGVLILALLSPLRAKPTSSREK